MKSIRIAEVGTLRRFKLFKESSVNYIKIFSGFGWHYYLILTTWEWQATKENVHVFVRSKNTIKK